MSDYGSGSTVLREWVRKKTDPEKSTPTSTRTRSDIWNAFGEHRRYNVPYIRYNYWYMSFIEKEWLRCKNQPICICRQKVEASFDSAQGSHQVVRNKQPRMASLGPSLVSLRIRNVYPCVVVFQKWRSVQWAIIDRSSAFFWPDRRTNFIPREESTLFVALFFIQT
jgi:hypothetical protein